MSILGKCVIGCWVYRTVCGLWVLFWLVFAFFRKTSFFIVTVGYVFIVFDPLGSIWI